jgi:hypothetical protein
MKITIDTKEDSHEDIQKVMQILQHFTRSSTQVAQNITPTAPVQDTSSMMSMFGDTPSSQSATPEPLPQTAPDFSSFLNLADQMKKEEEKSDDVKIELF